MAKLYCPNCGPIRITMMRSSAGLDLDNLPPGPVPGSKCGICGKQLYAGSSTSTCPPLMCEEKYRPFVVGAITGCILWLITGGFIHAYVISPDWDAMGQNAVAALIGWRPFVALICTGFVFGFSVEVGKFIGALFRSEGAVLFLPIMVGAIIGALQGGFVVSNLWGFAADTVFRGENLRLLTGAICGFILSYPTVMIGIIIRRRGTPW
jgi:hypothetical protein